jgi:hypothetical protein
MIRRIAEQQPPATSDGAARTTGSADHPDGDRRAASMPWWLRLYLLLGTAQGMGMGLTGLISPADMQIPLRISPLNTRVAAAMYTAAGLGLLLAAFTRRAHARILVLCFVAATTLILIVNLLHWSEFMAPTLPHRGLWIGAYVVDPILGVLVIASAGYQRASAPPAVRVRDAQGMLFLVAAGVLAVPGVVLLFVPAAASAVWPWALPPVLAQVYGCFFLAFALAGALAAAEARVVPRRTVAGALLALAVLVLSGSLLHLARFKPGLASGLWFGGFTALGIAFCVALLRDALGALLGRGRGRAGVPAMAAPAGAGARTR